MKVFDTLMTGLKEAIVYASNSVGMGKNLDALTTNTDGKWYKLSDLLELITEDSKREKLRKYRFQARFIEQWRKSNPHTDYSMGMRIGKIYFNYNRSLSVNVVPVADPHHWTTESPKRVELFIPDEVYRTKILPLVLASVSI